MMAKLPLEIWGLIVGQVHAAKNKNGLWNLCLVSRDFNDIASAWLYHSLDLDKIRLSLFAERLTGRNACYIRECETRMFYLDYFQLNLHQSVIQRLSTLRRFKWNKFDIIPDLLLEDLNRIKTLRELDLGFRMRLGMANEPFFPRLKGNTTITKLELHIENTLKGSEDSFTFQKCREIIAHAPALKSLIVSIDNSGEFLPSGYFSFRPDEGFPPLETLVLANYALGGGGRMDIANRLDVAKLQTLSLRDVHLESLNGFIKTLLGTHRVNLKHLSIQYTHPSDASSQERWLTTLDEFLESFIGLESLDLQNDWASNLPSLSAMITHGNTLQTLKIHSPRAVGNSPKKNDLSFVAEKLEAMSKSCPHIRELTIDLDRNKQSKRFVPLIQQSLRNFQSLRRLEIYTPLSRGNKTIHNPQVEDTYIDKFAAEVRSPTLEVFKVLVGGEDEFCHRGVNPLFVRMPEHLRWEFVHKFEYTVNYCFSSYLPDYFQERTDRRRFTYAV